MERKQVNLNIKTVELVKGEYEGHQYYQLQAITDEGFKLKTKLTEFEYNAINERFIDIK